MKCDEIVPACGDLDALEQSIRDAYLRRRFCLVAPDVYDDDAEVAENYTLRLIVGPQDFCLSGHYQNAEDTSWSADQAAKALAAIVREGDRGA